MKSDSPFLISLLSRALPPDLDHLSGDLEEEYRKRVRTEGRRRARRALTLQVLRSLPFLAIESIKWNLLMLAHYLKTGLRVIRRHVVYSVINVAGLAAGMAVCLLILLFIVDQRSYDRFHDDAGDIYRITSHFESGIGTNGPEPYATSPAGLGSVVESSIPGVSEVAVIHGGFRGEIFHDGESLSLQGIHAGPEFLDLFGFELISGDPGTALANPGSILLTPEVVTRLFGDEADPIGETITALGSGEYTVTGVIRAPRRTHIRFESVVSRSDSGTDGAWRVGLNNVYTYVRMNDEAAEGAEARLADIVDRQYDAPDVDYRLHGLELQPITRVNLAAAHSNEIGIVLPGFIGWFLAAFGSVIMLIAGFNYVTLTIARSINRSREIGVRRVMGAFRSSIFKQFLFESVLMAVLALMFAFALMTWMLPHFNSLFLINMSDGRIAFDVLRDFRVYCLFLAFSIGVGLLAGAWPARLFTSIEPVSALGATRSSGRFSSQTLRKIITVTQFTFALIFIITTAVLVQQFRFMSQADYGFDQELVVNVALQDLPYERFRSAFSDDAATVSIAASSKIPALGSTSSVRILSEAATDEVVTHEFHVDENYIATMGLDVLAGRNFDPRLASDSIDAAILGRSAVSALGLGSPETAIGAPIRVEEKAYTVVGVIDDFITNNPAEFGDPIILRHRSDRYRYAVVKVADGRISEFLSQLKSRWVDLGSIHTPKYEIFDEQLKSSEIIVVFADFLRVFGVITVFALLISCLGLLGMAMYSARNRVKEVGIRKVLGATPGNLVVVLSREYLLLIGIAVLIGSPVAWVLNSFWLSKLSNSVELGPTLFFLGIAGTTALALATVASQTIRAARTSIVDNLRSE